MSLRVNVTVMKDDAPNAVTPSPQQLFKKIDMSTLNNQYSEGGISDNDEEEDSSQEYDSQSDNDDYSDSTPKPIEGSKDIRATKGGTFFSQKTRKEDSFFRDVPNQMLSRWGTQSSKVTPKLQHSMSDKDISLVSTQNHKVEDGQYKKSFYNIFTNLDEEFISKELMAKDLDNFKTQADKVQYLDNLMDQAKNFNHFNEVSCEHQLDNFIEQQKIMKTRFRPARVVDKKIFKKKSSIISFVKTKFKKAILENDEDKLKALFKTNVSEKLKSFFEEALQDQFQFEKIEVFECIKCNYIDKSHAIEIIKQDKHNYFFIQKAFRHTQLGSKRDNDQSSDQDDNGTGKLAIRILKYNCGSKEMEIRDLIELNDYDIQCLDTQFTQYIISDMCIYFIKIYHDMIKRDSTDNVTQISLIKYDLIENEQTIIQMDRKDRISMNWTYSKELQKYGQLQLISANICKKNSLFNIGIRPKESLLDENTIGNSFIVFYFKNQDNKIIISIRHLQNYNNDLLILNLGKVSMMKFSQPHFLDCEYIQEKMEIQQQDTDLLVFGYKDPNKCRTLTKILSVVMYQPKNKQKLGVINIQDGCYKDDFQNINSDKYYQKKQLTQKVISALQLRSTNQSYYNYYHQNQNQNYYKLIQGKEVNNNINRTYSSICDYLLIDQEEAVTTDTVVIDQTHGQILFVQTNKNCHTLVIIDLNNKTERHMLCPHKARDTNLSSIEKIFKHYNGGQEMPDTIMISQEFNNLLRDDQNIFVIVRSCKNRLESKRGQVLSQKGTPRKKYQKFDVQAIKDSNLGFKHLFGNYIHGSKHACQTCFLTTNNFKQAGDTCLMLGYNRTDPLNKMLVYYDKNGPKKLKLQVTNIAFRDQVKDQNQPLEFQFVETSGFNDYIDDISYTFISESVIIKEDDRKERPLVIVQITNKKVKNVWFTIIDIKTKKIIFSRILLIEQNEFTEIMDVNDIKLTPSSQVINKKNNSNKGQGYLAQHYQICVLFKGIIRFKVWEFEVQWLKNQLGFFSINKNEFDVQVNLIGLKELIGVYIEDEQIKEFRFMTKFDKNFKITGSQIFIIYKKEKPGSIINIVDFKDHEYMDMNQIVNTGYKMIHHEQRNQFAIVVAQLSDLVQQNTKYFDKVEKTKILRTQIRTILNMVPSQIEQVLENEISLLPNCINTYDQFQCLEVLNGKCINDFYVHNPSHIENQLTNHYLKDMMQNDKVYEKNPSILLILLQQDPDNKRMEYFMKLGQLRKFNELSYDFQQSNILEKCLDTQFDQKLHMSGNIIIRYILTNKDQDCYQYYQTMMMKQFRQFNNLNDLKFDSLNGFINDLDNQTELDYIKINCMPINLKTVLNNPNLKHYSNKDLDICYLNENNSIIFNVEDHLQQQQTHVKDVAPRQGLETNFKVQHYMLDLRDYVFQRKITNFKSFYKTEQKNEMKPIESVSYSRLNLFEDIENYLNKQSYEMIEQQQVFKNLITFEYIETQKFFKILFLVYIFCFYFPLVLQIFNNQQHIVRICHLSCSCVMCFSFFNEVIQLRHQGFTSYKQSYWNLNDVLILCLYTNYAYLRVFNDDYKKDFLIVKTLEYIDDHQELEIIIDDIEHITNQTYITDSIAKTEDYNFGLDYLKNPVKEQVMMSLLSTQLLFQAFFKILYFLRIFPKYGRLVKLIFICIQDVLPFMIYFVSWIFLFSILFQVLGMEVFNDEYPDLNINITYLLFTYRNSIGDVSPPIYTYWLTMTETNPQLAWFMIILIWFFWFINQWVNLIIMLNFLITLIGKSYDQVMSDQVQLFFEYQTELIFEYQLIKNALKLTANVNIMIITYDIFQKIEENPEFRSLIETMQTFITKENQKVVQKIEQNSGMGDRLEKMEKTLDNFIVNMSSSMGQLKNQMKDMSNEFKIKEDYQTGTDENDIGQESVIYR